MDSSTITIITAKVHHFKKELNKQKGCYEVVISTFSPESRGANNFVMPEMKTFITINISSNYFNKYLDKYKLKVNDEIYIHGEFRQNFYQSQLANGLHFYQNEVFIYKDIHIFRLKNQPIEIDDDALTGFGRILGGLTINEVYLQGTINSAISIKSHDHGNDKIKIERASFLLRTIDKNYGVYEPNNHLIYTTNQYLIDIWLRKLKLNRGDLIHIKGRLSTKYNEQKQRTHSIEVDSTYDFEVINKQNLSIEIVNEGDSNINKNYYTKYE